MTNEEMREALAYNRRQKYAKDDVVLLQEVTGSTPDGEWGSRTVRALALWQEDHGLPGDGMLGPATWGAVRECSKDEIMCPPSLLGEPPAGADVVVGVWGDDNPNVMKSPRYADRLVELGISEVALMMNRANVSTHAEPWDLRIRDRGEEGWHDDAIGLIAEAYAQREIDLILTSWPRPSKEQIDEMCEAMLPLLIITRAVAWEVDVEGNWRLKFLQGFGTMAEAAAYLVMRMEQVLLAAGIEGSETEATTFGHHAELGAHPTVTPRVDRACIQGYSTCPRSSGKIIPWTSYLAPGRHQRWIFERARRAKVKEVVMGLAAYRQRFKGHRPEESMNVARDATVALGIRRIRLWSSKHILGSQARHSPYAAPVLEEWARRRAA